ncbi:WXG100 family type VII secretion target [Nocardioides sp. LHG3406-4]|uniref:WXG100 family type VII secretion target n=1 Tax=Nocardioides sp. LHG3406-4 TaxID=2804575 RepID=UPI003CEBAA5B
MNINVIHQAFTQAKADVAEGAGRLKSDRDRIDTRVSGFLGSGWTGVAADSFVDAWGDWKVAATDVLDGLVAMGELLEAAHKDYIDADDTSQQQLDQLSARLIDRLGG